MRSVTKRPTPRSPTMKLTDGEKLIILMLTEMYEKLQIKGETEPDFLRSDLQ